MVHHINRRQQVLELLILLLVPLLIWEGHVVWIVFTPATNLLKAAETGDIRRARYALARGANVNVWARSDSNTVIAYMTPLLLAVGGSRIPEVGKEHEGGEKQRRYVEMATLLLEHGADVNAKDSFGMTPLIRAVANVDKYLSRIIFIFFLGITPIYRNQIIKLLLLTYLCLHSCLSMGLRLMPETTRG